MQQVTLNTTYQQFATVGGKKVRIAAGTDGRMYQKIAETLPDGVDEKSASARASIEEKNPVHFSSDVPGFTGYWVEFDGVVDEPDAPPAPAKKTA